jgi:hypothetical protein
MDGELCGERNVKVKKADKPTDKSAGSRPAREGEYWQETANGSVEGGSGGGVCFDFQKGTCGRGSACRYSHEPAVGVGRGGGHFESRDRDGSDDKKRQRRSP